MSVARLVTSAMRWFQGQAASKDAAKSRLQPILIQDRASVDPGILEALREDLMGVLASYFEVIDDALDVQFERDGASLALVANIPIRTIRGRHDFQFTRRVRGEDRYGVDSAEEEPRIGPAAMPTDDTRRAVDTGGDLEASEEK